MSGRGTSNRGVSESVSCEKRSALHGCHQPTDTKSPSHLTFIGKYKKKKKKKKKKFFFFFFFLKLYYKR